MKSPHQHAWQDMGNHSYCRNPDNEPGGVWCFTTDPGKRWEYCSQVPKCIVRVDCRVEEWGAWSSCPATCGGERSRRRAVTRDPVLDGEECPLLEELQACESEGCRAAGKVEAQVQDQATSAATSLAASIGLLFLGIRLVV